MDASLLYYSEKLGKVVPRVLTLQWQITGAKTVSPVPQNSATLYGFDSSSFTQPLIDAQLGTSSEFVTAQFDATSLGTDAFGFVLAMNGQASKVLSMDAVSYTGSNGATVVVNHVQSSSTLSSTSLTAGVAVGANGNIGARMVLTGLDALTSGYIEVKIFWIAK